MSIGSITALFQVHRASPSHQAVVNLPFDTVPAWIPVSQTRESLIGRRVCDLESSETLLFSAEFLTNQIKPPNTSDIINPTIFFASFFTDANIDAT